MRRVGQDENRAAVAAVAAADLHLAGLAALRPRNSVNKGFKGLPLHT